MSTKITKINKSKNKPLVIFDLNGVLCYRHDDDTMDCDFVVEGRSIVLRPGCRDLLEEMYKNYDIGFFTSMTAKNGLPLLKTMLSRTQLSKTKIMWFRDRTRIDWENEGYKTVKNLVDIVDNPINNWDNKLKLQDILIIDDDRVKVRFNNPDNYLIIDSFTGDPTDDCLLNLPTLIAEKIELLQSGVAL